MGINLVHEGGIIMSWQDIVKEDNEELKTVKLMEMVIEQYRKLDPDKSSPDMQGLIKMTQHLIDKLKE